MPASPVALLREALTRGVCGAAQLCVRRDGRAVQEAALGELWPEGPELTLRTRFDAASVTKVLATTAAAMVLVARGDLDLDAPLDGALPTPSLNGRTARMLLGHRSGLAAWTPGFERARQDDACSGLWPGGRGGLDRERARALVLQAALEAPPASPPGPRVYSDLNFILLGELLSQISGLPLHSLCQREVFQPLELHDTGYLPIGEPAPRTPITGVWRPREPAPGQEGLYAVAPQLPRFVPGEVDDDNTWAMGGVAGHAGVFTTAQDLAQFGQALLDALDGDERWVPQAVARTFLSPDAPDTLPLRSLGFDRPALQGSSVGERFGRGPLGAVGHLGFTGTSLWLDLDRRLVVALLTNRSFPTRANTLGIRALRPAVHDAALELP